MTDLAVCKNSLFNPLTLPSWVSYNDLQYPPTIADMPHLNQ